MHKLNSDGLVDDWGDAWLVVWFKQQSCWGKSASWVPLWLAMKGYSTRRLIPISNSIVRMFLLPGVEVYIPSIVA
jgi:hypothetical protein